jgi:hypothetical protein
MIKYGHMTNLKNKYKITYGECYQRTTLHLSKISVYTKK